MKVENKTIGSQKIAFTFTVLCTLKCHNFNGFLNNKYLFLSFIFTNILYFKFDDFSNDYTTWKLTKVKNDIFSTAKFQPLMKVLLKI